MHESIDYSADMVDGQQVVQHDGEQRTLTLAFSMDVCHKDDALAFTKASSH